jgi:SAM-dependent methyltransferase
MRFENCPACGSVSLRPAGSRLPSDLQRCGACGLVFFVTRPTETALIEHYQNYPVTGSVPQITVKRYEELLRSFEPFRSTGKMLDVGCGEGFFLASAQKAGWEVYGTEFADIYLPICISKGIRMQQGRLNPANYSPGSFDVILWIEVIEHIDYPVQELENIRQLLRPGGVLYLTTPNFNAVSRRLLGGRWTVIDYPGHLTYYTPSSLKRLLEKSGFESVSVRTDGISIGRLKDALGKKKGTNEDFHAVDKDWQATLERNRINRTIKRLANSILAVTGSGDSLKGLFRKKP